MKKLRVLLADDHALVRAGIRSVVQALPFAEVIGEAADGREAIRLVRARRPDIVVMDVAMEGLNGLEATARIVQEFPAVHVLILSMHALEEYIVQALRAGASGYLLKSAAATELGHALKAVAAGQTYLSPMLSEKVIHRCLALAQQTGYQTNVLTPRQREVTQLLAEGKNVKEIAFLLNISVKTVETLRAQVMQRLDLHDVPSLVRYAMRRGMVPPESPNTISPAPEQG